MNSNTKSIFFFVLFFIILSFPYMSLADEGEVDDETTFTYEGKGPKEWGKINPEWKVCNTGKFQSPIDLTNKRVSLIRDKVWSREYKPAPAIITNRGHDVKVTWKGQDAGKIRIRGTDYKLDQCHWHSPSEHTFNGTRYDLELHMVHTSAEGKIAVVGLLYKLGQPDQLLTKLLNGLKAVEMKEEINVGMVDPREISFQTRKLYVIWTIVKKVNTISMEQITALRNVVHDGFETNSRPVQARHKITVWFYDPNV